MKEFYKNYLANNLYFWVFGGIATLLLAVSFLLPPLGVINSTVLQGAAELFAWATLGAVIHAIDAGRSAKLKRGETEITIGKEEKEDEE